MLPEWKSEGFERKRAAGFGLAQECGISGYLCWILGFSEFYSTWVLGGIKFFPHPSGWVEEGEFEASSGLPLPLNSWNILYFRILEWLGLEEA